MCAVVQKNGDPSARFSAAFFLADVCVVKASKEKWERLTTKGCLESDASFLFSLSFIKTMSPRALVGKFHSMSSC